MELVQPAGAAATPTTLQMETPVGTVNGVNTIFTVSHTPVFITIDGMTRTAGYGYTYATPTITTDPLTPPVQNIESFYNG